MTVEHTSVITCPVCSDSFSENMPTDSCRFFWECPACGEVSKPKQGDCCIYCSYGSNPCPPVQNTGAAKRRFSPVDNSAQWKKTE